MALPLTSSCLLCLHPSPLSSNKPLFRPQSPDLIQMIKSFFFSTNFVPPLLLSGSCRTPSLIDRHAEEITLIAGITSPHVGWPHTGGRGEHLGWCMLCMMCKCMEGGWEGWRSKIQKIWAYVCLFVCEYQKMKRADRAIVSGYVMDVIKAFAVHTQQSLPLNAYTDDQS